MLQNQRQGHDEDKVTESDKRKTTQQGFVFHAH
jgi:hypothetical protein